MKRFAVSLLALGAVVVAFAASGSVAQDKKDGPMTVPQIMKQNNGAIKAINAELKAAEPKWDAVAAKSKIALNAVKDLAKNEPKKGDAASWKKLSEEYVASFAKLGEAADNKDLDATKAAMKTIGSSCKACHDAHKEE